METPLPGWRTPVRQMANGELEEAVPLRGLGARQSSADFPVFYFAFIPMPTLIFLQLLLYFFFRLCQSSSRHVGERP